MNKVAEVVGFSGPLVGGMEEYITTMSSYSSSELPFFMLRYGDKDIKLECILFCLKESRLFVSGFFVISIAKLYRKIIVCQNIWMIF